MNTSEQLIEKSVDLPQLRSWGDDKWRQKAACKGHGASCFFPSKEEAHLMQACVNESKLICSKCTVRKECLTFAIENGLHHGVYGGLAPRERRNMDTNNLDCRMPVTVVIKCLKQFNAFKKIPSRGIVSDLATHLGISIEKSEELIADAQNQYV